MSNDSEEFKRYIVPKYLIVLTLIFGICCATYVGWLITNYQILKSKMPLLIKLQKENEEQRIAFAQMANRIKQIGSNGGKSQETKPQVSGSQTLEPVGNAQNGQTPDIDESAPDLMPTNYSMGGGEPPEKDTQPAQAVTQLAALSHGDSQSSIGPGSTKLVSTPEVEESVISKKVITYPYSLQIGSYRTLKRADSAISIYRKKALSPYWVKVDLGKNGTWYRVFVGHFSNKENAKNYKEEHNITRSLIKRIPYANLIGVYMLEEQFEDEMTVLESKGYFPYFIKDEDERFRLFVGGFFTKAGVERQHAKLFDDGVLSEIVER